MDCLISGHDGFIGRALTRELTAMGHSVRGLEHEDGSVVDLRDWAAIEAVVARVKPTTVYHLGGISGPMLSLDEPRVILRVNCEGTLNIIRAGVQHGTRRFIYASSISALAFGDQLEPLPDSIYGATKRFGEILTWHYGRICNVQTTSVRIGSVFGIGRITANPIHSMVRSALSAKKIPYEPNFPEPCIAVDDCARLLARLCEVSRLRARYDAVAYLVTREAIAMLIADLTGATPVPSIPSDEQAPTYPRGFDVPSNITCDAANHIAPTLRERILELIEHADKAYRDEPLE